jgi:catechol 2,3-dioxygenase-like lactoylglutathione lyase family enzyme
MTSVILSHVSIGTNDFDRSLRFYDRVLTTLSCVRMEQHEGAVGYGRRYPEFWVHTPVDGTPATVANGGHIAFVAASREEVVAFFRAALSAGATSEGEPGPRPAYGEAYYGCFVRDPDGHKIEAIFWDAPIP